MHRRWYTAGALIAGLSILASACGATPSGGGGASGDTSKGEIIIASNQPTSGGDASDGLPAQNGIQFAVESKGSIKEGVGPPPCRFSRKSSIFRGRGRRS